MLWSNRKSNNTIVINGLEPEKSNNFYRMNERGDKGKLEKFGKHYRKKRKTFTAKIAYDRELSTTPRAEDSRHESHIVC